MGADLNLSTPFSNQLSRRTLLHGAAAVSFSRRMRGQVTQTALAYVGTYSSPQGPEGSKGNGKGICLFEVDLSSGRMKQRAVFATDTNPSWLAFDPSARFLFVANEINTYESMHSGSVSSFAVDRTTGYLTLVNTVSSRGAGPAHLSVHPSGRFVFVANYAGGTIAVLPVTSKGELGAATDVKEDHGETGSIHAASSPPGSFAVSGHERPHAHMIRSDPAGRFVLSTDLALDRILLWRFDSAAGKLLANNPPFVSLPTGDGPRHFAFHPNGRYVYSLQEEGSTLVTFDYDSELGRLTERQSLSTLPTGFAGTNFTSEILVTPNGRFVYVGNRLHDSIARFSVSPTGTLSYLGETWTRGDYPRSFSMDLTGNLLFSCNQRSDAIATFRADSQTGNLEFTGGYTPVGTPAIIVFLPKAPAPG